MNDNLVESLKKLKDDSKSTLIEYLAEHTEYVRFFSYGSNMNREKFHNDMKKRADELGLKLSEKEKNNLELDNFAEKRVLLHFKRELSNKSERHGRAYSIAFSLNSKVEGICHNVHVSVLPAFLKKEGLRSPDPSYEIIKVCVSGENQEVLTLIGLKPEPLEKVGNKIQNALEYVKKSIYGAIVFDVEHSDMIKDKELLERKIIESNGK